MAGGQWAGAGFMQRDQLGIAVEKKHNVLLVERNIGNYSREDMHCGNCRNNGIIGQSIQCNKNPVTNLTNDSLL